MHNLHKLTKKQESIFMDLMHVSQPKPEKTSGYLGCPIWVLQPIS
jgi:hypothetical protein